MILSTRRLILVDSSAFLGGCGFTLLLNNGEEIIEIITGISIVAKTTKSEVEVI
jgi:hypothetical protein